jgi:hypothetical protein
MEGVVYAKFLRFIICTRKTEPKKDMHLSDLSKQKLIEWYNKVDFSNKSNKERRQIFNDLLDL